ncbi:hypothetical protein ACI2KR_30425 [Pseudomonas luteola]
MSTAKLELRRIVSKHQSSSELVSEHQALNVIDSLVIKNGRNDMSCSDKALFDELKEKGFIED